MLPFVPAVHVKPATAEDVGRTLLAYDLPTPCFFHPAQVWPHENHVRVVRALKILADRGIDAPLVLAGCRRLL